MAGAACGYATYEYSDYSSYEGYGDGGEGAPVPAYINLKVYHNSYYAEDGTPPTAGIPADGGEQMMSADFTITPRDEHENYPTLADRHQGPTDNSDIGDSGGPMDWYTYAYDYPYGRMNGGAYPALTEDTTAGFWCDGAEGCGYYSYYYDYDPKRNEGAYVAGTATNMAYLDSMNAGNVEADYFGRAMHSYTPVDIHIDFGDGTWSGNWNHGRDGYINNVVTDENGVTHVEGQVGFYAEGHLSGPNIVSDSVGADDGQVRGRVEGSFFGSEAQVLAGVSDITKTVNEGDAEHYTNARNVDVFVTVKDSLVDQVDDTFVRD